MTETDDDELFATVDEVAGEDEPPLELPDLPAVQAAFLRRMRELTPTWRGLGFERGDAFVGVGDDRVWVGLDLTDRHDSLRLGGLRIDVAEAEWSAGHVDTMDLYEPEFDDPTAGGPIVDAEPDIAAALDWLTSWFADPLVRYRRWDAELDCRTAGSWQYADGWPRPDSNGDGDWFPVTADDPDTDPEPAGVAAACLRRLDDMVPTWRALGIELHDVDVRWGDGRLRVAIQLVDRDVDAVFGVVRVDLGETRWSAGWAHPFSYTHADFWGADPLGEDTGTFTDPDRGIDDALGWLVTELRRPVTRRAWRRDGEITDCWWTVTGNGVETIVSYAPFDILDPETADDTAAVRTAPPDAG